MPVRAQLPDLEHWKAQVKCQAGCPVRTDAGRYVQLVAERRDEEAYLVARAPNPFASVCGRICAAPCEDACRRGNIDAPISIRALKRYVTERYGVESRRPDTQDRLREQAILEGNLFSGHLPVVPFTGSASGPRRKVAVVGAGPAGMSAAHDLALLGYAVTVFDASPEPGGMMRFGIPEYRLPRTLIHAGDPEDPGARRDAEERHAAHARARPRRAAARTASRPSSCRSGSRRAATCRCPESSSTAS